MEKKIELTKGQVLTLLSQQINKCSFVIEYFKLLELKDKCIVWSGDGVEQLDGVLYITEIYKDLSIDLLLKVWRSIETIPLKNLRLDNSDNVRNIALPKNHTKYYISYTNYGGLLLSVVVEKENEKIEYNISLIIEQL